MKKILTPLLLLLVVTMSLGCTRNNGDIGLWFGSWRLEAIDIDGREDTAIAPPYYIWKFQNHIIQIIRPNDIEHNGPWAVGSWTDNDTTVTLDFTHDLGNFNAEMHLQPVTTLEVVTLSSRTLVLRHTHPSPPTSVTPACIYTYRFTRWS